MRWLRFVLLALFLTTVGTAHANAPNGRACPGRTFTDGDACCISGMVTLDGKPVVGALVTVQLVGKNSNNVVLSDITEFVDNDKVPTYGFSLHDEPLGAQPGDVLAITVSYEKVTRQLIHKVEVGEQWLDIELNEPPSTSLPRSGR